MLHSAAESALGDAGMLSNPQRALGPQGAGLWRRGTPHSPRCRGETPSLPLSPSQSLPLSPSPSPGTHPRCRRVPRREARKGGRGGFGTEEEEGEAEEGAVGRRGAASRPAGAAPSPAAAAAGCRLPAWRWGWMEGEPGGGRGVVVHIPGAGQ